MRRLGVPMSRIALWSRSCCVAASWNGVLVALIAAVLLTGVILWLVYDMPRVDIEGVEVEVVEPSSSPMLIMPPEEGASKVEVSEPDDEPAEDAAGDESKEEQPTQQELALANWEKSFDGFVKLQEDEKWTPSETDIAKFKTLFDKMDAEQRLEQVPHAQNLFSDASFGFLKAILMDPSEPQDVLESIYYDLLNRHEELKYPVLREVYKVKNHPLRDEIEGLDEMLGDF